MPEGDTIFRAARTLHKALAGKPITGFQSVFPRLMRVDEDAPIAGRTIEQIIALGKWMEMHLSGDLVLVTHMLMNGSWHIYRPREPWKRSASDMRVLIATADFVAVAFNIQVAEFHTAASLVKESPSQQITADLLAADFHEEQAIARLRAAAADTQVGEALLKQTIVAGIGNVYKSEVCFACHVHPFATMGSLNDAEVRCLVQTARKFMRANVQETSGEAIVTYTGFRRTTGRANPGDRLWVYGRRGQPCRRCGTRIEARKQGVDARITFWCPKCQVLKRVAA